MRVFQAISVRLRIYSCGEGTTTRQNGSREGGGRREQGGRGGGQGRSPGRELNDVGRAATALLVKQV